MTSFPPYEEWNAATFEKEIQDCVEATHPSEVAEVTDMCWGCGKPEPPGVEFLGCPLCKKEGFLSAPFCSNKCWHKHYPRHKEWHEKGKIDKKQQQQQQQQPDLELRDSFEKSRKELTSDQDTDKTLARFERGIFELRTGSCRKATKTFLKAQKKTQRPDHSSAYYQLALCYSKCNRTGEYIQYNLLTVDALAGQVLYQYMALLLEEQEHGELFTSEQRQLLLNRLEGLSSFFARTVSDILLCIFTRGYKFAYQKPPMWLCQADMLKKVMKFTWDTFQKASAAGFPHQSIPKDETSFQYLAKIGYEVAMGRFRGGVLHDYFLHPNDVSLNDFKDAEMYARFMGRSNKGWSNKADDLAAAVKRRLHLNAVGLQDRNNESSLDAGTWVFIQGIQKLGVVCKGAPRDGKLPVQMDGVDEGQFHYVSVAHLTEIPLTSALAAILFCAAKPTQWKFMRVFVRFLRFYGQEFVTQKLEELS